MNGCMYGCMQLDTCFTLEKCFASNRQSLTELHEKINKSFIDPD